MRPHHTPYQEPRSLIDQFCRKSSLSRNTICQKMTPRLLLRRPFALTTTIAQRTNFSTTSIKPDILGRPSREKTYGYILGSSQAAAFLRRQLPSRTGAIATKIGMSAYFTPSGQRIPCTILQLDRVQVVSVKRMPIHPYWAVQLGSGWKKPGRITKPMLGHFAACGVCPKQVLCEFRVKGREGLLPPGTLITVDHFSVGQFVDVWGNCKGKGFAGGMKRHGWRGQPASHGNSLSHRAMGSAGQSQGGGSRVYPGKRMPGRMGGHSHTVQNLKVLEVNKELETVVIAGCVSGPNGATVKIQDSIKKPFQNMNTDKGA